MAYAELRRGQILKTFEDDLFHTSATPSPFVSLK